MHSITGLNGIFTFFYHFKSKEKKVMNNESKFFKFFGQIDKRKMRNAVKNIFKQMGQPKDGSKLIYSLKNKEEVWKGHEILFNAFVESYEDGETKDWLKVESKHKYLDIY